MHRRRATSNITDRRLTENIIRVRTIRDRITDDKISDDTREIRQGYRILITTKERIVP
jgi:hypothetical protein